MAIHLGTANTLFGIPGNRLVLDEPAVVAIDRANGKILSNLCAVGHSARVASQLLRALTGG